MVGHRLRHRSDASAYAATKTAQVAIAISIEENTSIRHPEQTAFPVEYPAGKMPLSEGRPGGSGDQAEAIVFLSSGHTRHIAGTPRWIDGTQGLLL